MSVDWNESPSRQQTIARLVTILDATAIVLLVLAGVVVLVWVPFQMLWWLAGRVV